MALRDIPSLLARMAGLGPAGLHLSADARNVLAHHVRMVEAAAARQQQEQMHAAVARQRDELVRAEMEMAAHPLTGAEIRRRNDEDYAITLEQVRRVQLEMMRLMPNPPMVSPWPQDVERVIGQVLPEIEMNIESSPIDHPDIIRKRQVDAKIAAERLLRTVLPEDLHISLAATNECKVNGKDPGFSYQLKKNAKTLCTKKDGSVHSCCIGLSDTSAPDTDRIVAEYLLITNDEPQYLKTANLTCIRGGPIAEQTGVSLRMIREFDREQNFISPNVMGQWTADDHRERRTYIPRLSMPVAMPERQGLSPQMLCAEMFRLVFSVEHLSRRFPDMAEDRWRGLAHTRQLQRQVEITNVELATLPMEELRALRLNQAAHELQQELAPDRINLFGFLRQPLPEGLDAACEMHHDGKSIRYTRAYDFVHDILIGRFDIMAVVGR